VAVLREAQVAIEDNVPDLEFARHFQAFAARGAWK